MRNVRPATIRRISAGDASRWMQRERMDATYHLNGAFKPATRRFADLEGADFYPTPDWATQALIDHEQFDGDIWEPACGDGAMADVLRRTGCEVYASDLYDRGYGDTGVDFLASKHRAANIITNPPYNAAESFVHKCLDAADRKFALLLRLAFLEGGNRQKTIFGPNPPSRVWVFSERITFYPKNAVRKGSGTTAYAWFVWDKSSKAGSELCWFPPGLKRRYGSQTANPMLFK